MKINKKRIKEELKYFVILFLIVGTFFYILIKTFSLNNPEASSFQVAVSYFKAEQNFQREEAEKYLFSELSEVKILEKNYEDVRYFLEIAEEKKEIKKEPVFEEKKFDSKEEGKIVVLEKMNKKQGFAFFGFNLPDEVLFEVELKKQGNWFKGYNWKIIKIDSSTLISNGVFGKEAQIKKDFFVKPIKFEKYSATETRMPKELEGYTLEVEYSNNSDKKVFISPFNEWIVVDIDGKEYGSPPYTSAYFLRDPAFSGGEIKQNGKEKGYVSFELPKETLFKKIIFISESKKITFDLE